MITINYQTFGNKGFQLRLRLYQAGETKFINVTKFLKGTIKKQYRNQKNLGQVAEVTISNPDSSTSACAHMIRCLLSCMQDKKCRILSCLQDDDGLN